MAPRLQLIITIFLVFQLFLDVQCATPVFTAPNPSGGSSVSFGETAITGGDTIYTISVTGATSIALNPPSSEFVVISSTIQVQSGITFDYESGTTSYTLTVEADDGGGLTSTAILTVQITDEIDETPTITGSLSGTVAEGQPTGTVISFSYTVGDTDASDTLMYSFASGGAPNFQIDTSTGTISTADILDYEGGTITFNPVLKVTDSASPGNTATATLTIGLTNVNDNAPIFTPSVYTASIDEGTAASGCYISPLLLIGPVVDC